MEFKSLVNGFKIEEIEMSQIATLVNLEDSIEVKPIFRSSNNTINSSLIKIRVK